MGVAGLTLLTCLNAADSTSLPPPSKAQVRFSRDVQPLLEKRCYGCHGARQQMSGLRLDEKTAALKGGAAGKDIVAGNSAASRLIRYVAGVGKTVMPPVGAHLTVAEVGLLRAWIDQGVDWPAESSKPSHWAFQPIRRPTLPLVRNKAWVSNPIDRFVLARLEKENITPSPEADKSTLLRRLSLDLTGLLPTPEEVEAFLSDTTPGAYERVVDNLLASPHYGEKWGRYWLDLARYADSDGYEKDRSRPWAWRYRQWVIEALNRDLPFDQFTIEQLAGEVEPNKSTDTLIATGFNRNTLTNREGGTDPEQFRDEQVLDRTATLGTVWLGLTVGCAQCHDHKYDPISQKEFYQLSAFFNTQEEVNIPAPLPGEMGPYLAARPHYEAQKKDLLDRYGLKTAEAEWERVLREAALRPGQHEEWDFAYGEFRHTVDNAKKVLFKEPSQRTELEETSMELTFLRSCSNAFSRVFCDSLKVRETDRDWYALLVRTPQISYAPVLVESDTPPKTYIHVKGDWREHGSEVQPGTLAVLPPLRPGTDPPRLVLARWLVSRENPLTSRVAVNRIWQELFGRGIVKTSEDFGTQGDRPSHPELLDWLAGEFMDRGWSMKHMIRLIVTSSAYRQSSKSRSELAQRDPDNALLARQSRLRLPAELVRDAALRVSGLLDLRLGGPSVKPPQPKGVAELSYGGSVQWDESSGADRYRRGLYIHFQRTTPYPQLTNFDAPNSNLSCTRRERTDTPLQALNLMNDPVFFEAARALAYRVVTESRGAFRDRLNYAYRVTLARAPSAHEAERMGKYFDETLASFEQNPYTADELFPNRVDGLPPSNAAAWVELSRVLLNLDEFITRE